MGGPPRDIRRAVVPNLLMTSWVLPRSCPIGRSLVCPAAVQGSDRAGFTRGIRGSSASRPPLIPARRSDITSTDTVAPEKTLELLRELVEIERFREEVGSTEGPRFGCDIDAG